jgi:prephenate dehydratase
MAAIGSGVAAKVYGLEIAASGIQDNDNNLTRFVVLSKKSSEKASNNKTSIVFSTEDKPGSLYRILDIFGLWDINMTRIESRPAKNELGKYIFFVDLKGHIDDDELKDALTMVMRKTSFYKFLGSYPEFGQQV